MLFVGVIAATKGAAGQEVGELVQTNQLAFARSLPRVYEDVLAVASQKGRQLLSADAQSHEVRISSASRTLHGQVTGLLIVKLEPAGRGETTLVRIIGG